MRTTPVARGSRNIGGGVNERERRREHRHEGEYFRARSRRMLSRGEGHREAGGRRGETGGTAGEFQWSDSTLDRRRKVSKRGIASAPIRTADARRRELVREVQQVVQQGLQTESAAIRG